MNAIKFETTRPLLHFTNNFFRAVADCRRRDSQATPGRGMGDLVTGEPLLIGYRPWVRVSNERKYVISLYALHFQFFRCYYCE